MFNTSFKAPQPQGEQVAKWFNDNAKLTATDLLYALAHMKANRDELLESVLLAHEFLDSLPKGWLGKTSGDVGALNDFYIKSKLAITKAKGE